jgi:Icc-related predicted phosphoesterase
LKYFNFTEPHIVVTGAILPEGVTSIIVSSDLQGREDGQRNRLVGEQVVDEIIALQEHELISDVDLVILAGDLYDYPDCRKRGGSGDVTSVWNAFASNFEKVVGVHGNHDKVTEDELLPNVTILDGNGITYKDINIGGVSGIIGKVTRNQRKSYEQFQQELSNILNKRCDIVVLHAGPDDPENNQRGEPMVRTQLENTSTGLAVFGHCYWDIPLITIGTNQVLNVDSKVFIFEK